MPPGSAVMNRLAVGELGAVVGDVEHLDDARRGGRLDDVHLRLVRREREAVGPVDVARDDRGAAGPGVEAVDVGRQLRLRRVAFVVAEDAERRVGEPDRVVGLHHHVVGRVERLAVELVDQHGDGAVELGAGHAPRIVLAGDQPALAIARVAVGVVGGLAEDADAAGLLLPAHDAVVGDVAPHQVAAGAEPGRSLAPAHAGGKPLHAGEAQPVLAEARIEDLDGRVGIALAGPPLRQRRRRCSGRDQAAPAVVMNLRLVCCMGSCPPVPATFSVPRRSWIRRFLNFSMAAGSAVCGS